MGRYADPLAVEFRRTPACAPASGRSTWAAGPAPSPRSSCTGWAPTRCRPSTRPSRSSRPPGPGSPGWTCAPGSRRTLPFDDDSVDLALAQLVVHFMATRWPGSSEMRRVTRPGGRGRRLRLGPRRRQRSARHVLAGGPRPRPGRSRRGRACPARAPATSSSSPRAAGSTDVEDTRLTVEVVFASYDDWWAPYTLGVGPAGSYVAGLDDAAPRRAARALRSRCCPRRRSRWPPPRGPSGHAPDEDPRLVPCPSPASSSPAPSRCTPAGRPTRRTSRSTPR